MTIGPNATTLTVEQKKLILMAEAIAELIQAVGSVPSGHLYSRLCGSVSFDDYTTAIGLLVKIGKIRNTGHLLTWNG